MKTIQLAFRQAMGTIADDLGLKTDDLNLLVKCANDNVCLLARNNENVLKVVPLQKMIGTKMLSLRMTVEKLTHFFRCVHAAYVTSEKPINPDAVSLVLYSSKLAREICVGVYVGNKAEKCYRLSELTDIAGTGTEKDGELN